MGSGLVGLHMKDTLETSPYYLQELAKPGMGSPIRIQQGHKMSKYQAEKLGNMVIVDMGMTPE